MLAKRGEKIDMSAKVLWMQKELKKRTKVNGVKWMTTASLAPTM